MLDTGAARSSFSPMSRPVCPRPGHRRRGYAGPDRGGRCRRASLVVVTHDSGVAAVRCCSAALSTEALAFKRPTLGVVPRRGDVAFCITLILDEGEVQVGVRSTVEPGDADWIGPRQLMQRGLQVQPGDEHLSDSPGSAATRFRARQWGRRPRSPNNARDFSAVRATYNSGAGSTSTTSSTVSGSLAPSNDREGRGVGGITRFATVGHFASWTGSVAIDVSCRWIRIPSAIRARALPCSLV